MEGMRPVWHLPGPRWLEPHDGADVARKRKRQDPRRNGCPCHETVPAEGFVGRHPRRQQQIGVRVKVHQHVATQRQPPGTQRAEQRAEGLVVILEHVNGEPPPTMR
eukprot:CAMPEP_0182940278 /NCGR_PEP_ID=MMETSP0105_2-20130417/47037_1 /TAXON_ID=81532 ORGANISM="Acanthoeca-like sp., Strain 10tr" /NCGR_SAMPLE_ID=MMETSP0105_2 /ASSEMBLY_ACC=CAM_ASM_000205 /LENGTH=105 /DNA_ID=CAMNT_0025079757 /DNA_START=165 /DNA_END=478 /DNA_ORIENTATION=-